MGCCDAGIDVGLGGLRTHLLGGGEVTLGEELQEFAVGSGHDVGHVLEVLALLHELDELGLVDDLLAGSVYQHGTLGHILQQGVVDRLLGLGSGGDVERHDLALLIQLLGRSYGGDAIGGHHLGRAVGIVSIDVHAEALGDACHVAAYVAIGVDTEFLSLELAARGAIVEVAHGIYHHAKSQLGHGIGVLAGGVHHTYAMSRCGGEVYIVVACTGTHHDLELLGGIEHLGIDYIAADDDGIGIGHGSQQVGLIAIFF